MAETHEPHGAGVDQELNFKAIFGFVIGLSVLVLVVGGLMFGFSAWQKARLVKSDPPAPVLAEARVKSVPDGPLLQSDPARDMRELRAREDAVLSSWAWTDASKTHARVPADRAIEIVLAKGFPPRTAPPAEAPPASGAAPSSGATK